MQHDMQIRRSGTILGRVPVNCRFMRLATPLEISLDRDCIALFETQDGQHIWLPRDTKLE